MKKLHSIQAAMGALYTYIPNAADFKTNYTLDRMRQFLAGIGNPQDAYQSIHIAGTSGKTSTAYFIRSFLQDAGHMTGLTVSPHIVSVTERVQIDGQPLSDDEFLNYLNRFLPMVEASAIRLTYFEVLMAFAYWVFAERGVRYAVVETGLGGLLDASNVITRSDKVCVITDIGLDHTEILGETIDAIAFQKAGIIQPGNHVFLIEQNRQAVSVVAAKAAACSAPLQVIAPTAEQQWTDAPAFQRRNMTLAVAVCRYVAERDGFAAPSDDAVRAAFADAPPGRMERYTVHGHELILDGAHNPQKLHALRQALEESGVHSAAVLASLLRAPEQKLTDSLTELRPLATHLIIPEFSVVRDIGKESVSAEGIADRARLLGFRSIQISQQLPDALAALLDRSEPVLLVTGSLYLVSQIRALLEEQGAGRAQ